MRVHGSREKHGIRWWWNLTHRTCVHIEFYWWTRFCGVTIGTDEEGWNLSLRLPPFLFHLSLEGFPLWQPQKVCIATWDNDRVFTIPDRREFDVSVSAWTLRLTPWGRWGEWHTRDPWWIRGLSFDMQRFVLGQRTYHAEELALVPVMVPMPEGSYHAVAKVQRVTRGFQRWRKRTALEVVLDIPKGIPFAGKGENSWDCGDDGLFGIGGDSIDDAIRRAQDAVNQSRRQYGHASPEAVREALA